MFSAKCLRGDLYVSGDLHLSDDLVLDNITGSSLKITGISTLVGPSGHVGLSTFGGGIDVVAGVTTFREDIQFKGAAYDIQWDQATSKFKFDDAAQLVFGSASGGDMKLYHTGGNSTIKNETGQFRIAGNDLRLQSQDSSEDYLLAVDGGSVSIFFNDVKRLETSSSGVNITDTLNVAGVATFASDVDVDGELYVASNIRHKGDSDTYIEFTGDQMRFIAGGKPLIHAEEGTVDTVIINDGSNDLDFRVEGQNDEYQIFSDGSTDRVGIGSAIPTVKFDVLGAANVSGTFTAGLIDGGSY